MKKKIVSLLLTGTLVLSASTGVLAAESKSEEATPAAQSGNTDEESGDLIGGLLSLVGLKDEYDAINKLGDKIGIGGLDDLADNLGINSVEDLGKKLGFGDINELGEKLGIGDLTEKLFGDDAVVDINSLVDGAVSSGILENLIGEDNMAKVEGLLDGLGITTDSEDAAAAVEGAVLDYAVTFPSWNPDSESLAELVDFVSRCTDESDPAYVDPADRIATFDMDGTILCEKAPVYFDYCLTMHRVLDDETFKATKEEKDSMEQIREHAYTKGETFHPEGITKADLVASAFAGMTPAEFRSYVNHFADTVDAVGFEGMKYGESFYKPMLEVMDYLEANDFDVWMVSACEREVVRALMERFDFPYDHVIATDVPYVASGKGDEKADEYNMSKDETILLGAPLDPVECGKSGKPAAIAREIGKRPILAFGNSSGDYSMLNYAEGNTDHEGMGFFVVCDDTQREYGSDEKAADYYKEVKSQGWTAISMADDWATIYEENVVKTELPGAKSEEAMPDAA